eukprot:543556_1
MSKLILLSYNLKRSILYLNTLSYALDVVFAMTCGIFLSAFIFQQIFTFTGMYITLELLILVPFFVYYYIEKLSLSFMTLLIFWYPFAIYVLSGFSLYPILTKFLCRPEEIGRKQMFHLKLYEYCCKSEDKAEFMLKLKIANYVCIQSYFHILKESDDPDYFSFANELYNTNPSQLPNIKFSPENHIRNQNWIGHKGSFVLKIMWMKLITLALRICLIVAAVLMDVFYNELFQQDSQFMQYYGNVILLLGIVISIFLITWIGGIVYQLFVSKWSLFCHHMITSKHSSFFLVESIEDFIAKCDLILAKTNKCNLEPSDKRKVIPPSKTINQRYIATNTSAQFVLLFCYTISLFYLGKREYWSEGCSLNVIRKYNVIGLLIILSSLILLTLDKNANLRRNIRIYKATIFSSLTSQIILYLWSIYVYDKKSCNVYIFILLIA